MAYRKRNPRVRKMKKILRKGKAKGMLAMMKQVASQVLIRKAETKYVAKQLFQNASVSGTLDIPGDLHVCLPPLLVGTESYQRTGSRISNIRGRTIFTFWLDSATQSANCNNISVKIFFLNSKQTKSSSQAQLLPSNILLDNGDGTSTDWSSALPGAPLLYNQLPISNENFSGRTKTIRLVKNIGQPNAVGGNVVDPNTYGRVMVTYVYNWSRKSAAAYENNITNAALAFPTNYAPLFGVVAFTNDSSIALADNTVYMDVRNEMYFKDV